MDKGQPGSQLLLSKTKTDANIATAPCLTVFLALAATSSGSASLYISPVAEASLRWMGARNRNGTPKSK